MEMQNSPIKYQNNFNIIRLFAALQVLIVHVYNHFEVSNGFIVALKGLPGVPLFFFISGFLITKTYVRKRDLGDLAYFINRAIRIFPALILCVLLTIIAIYLTGYFDGRHIPLWHVVIWTIGQATIGQVYNPEFMSEFGVGVINGALWTISVELQFYILTPILFKFFRKWLVGFILLFILSVAVNVLYRIDVLTSIPYSNFLYVSFFPWVFMFMIGFLFAISPRIQDLVRRIPFLMIFGLYILSMLTLGSYELNAMNSINPLSAALLGLLVFRIAYMDLRVPSPLRKFTDKNDISYGIYIYHMPIINFLLFYGIFQFQMNFIITFVLASLLALLSWKLVEKPLLKFKNTTFKK